MRNIFRALHLSYGHVSLNHWYRKSSLMRFKNCNLTQKETTVWCAFKRRNKLYRLCGSSKATQIQGKLLVKDVFQGKWSPVSATKLDMWRLVRLNNVGGEFYVVHWNFVCRKTNTRGRISEYHNNTKSAQNNKWKKRRNFRVFEIFQNTGNHDCEGTKQYSLDKVGVCV